MPVELFRYSRPRFRNVAMLVQFRACINAWILFRQLQMRRYRSERGLVCDIGVKCTSAENLIFRDDRSLICVGKF
jgi:hypothetical protein